MVGSWQCHKHVIFHFELMVYTTHWGWWIKKLNSNIGIWEDLEVVFRIPFGIK